MTGKHKMLAENMTETHSEIGIQTVVPDVAYVSSVGYLCLWV